MLTSWQGAIPYIEHNRNIRSESGLPKFYEFFAGGGMARAGLGDDWQCLFANDFDERKCEIYRANWGGCE